MKQKTFLIRIIALVVMTLLGTVAFGQQIKHHRFMDQSPEMRAGIITKVMKNRLGLTPEQAGKAYRINLKYARLVQPYLPDIVATGRVPEKMLMLKRQRIHELYSLLTPLQRRKFEQLKQQRILKMEKRLTRLKEQHYNNP